jgi:site-specific recombinase XerD
MPQTKQVTKQNMELKSLSQPLPLSRRRDRIITYMTQAELKRLLAGVKDKRDQAIIKTAYRHGLRASEVGLLQRDDVDLKQGRITIRRLKGSLGGVYPMSADTVKVIHSYLRTRDPEDSPYLFISNRGLPIDRRTLWKMMQTYAGAAGLHEDKQHFHILKHSIATHLLDAGADLSFVKDWLGHANIQNTTIYARLTSTTRDAKARQLFASHRVV